MGFYSGAGGTVEEVVDSNLKYFFGYGEGFLYETLPLGTRLLYPPPPLAPHADARAAIREAFDKPVNFEPLDVLLKPGMKLTVVFDDLSLPLPPMESPDIREMAFEIILEKCAMKSVEDIHFIAATNLHRKMTPAELKHAVGKKIYDRYAPKQLYNHDSEDPEGVSFLGKTDKGEEVWCNRRVAESDLVIYVNINFVSMDGGHKSLSTGVTNFKTVVQNHDPETLLNVHSLMDPPHSHLHHSCKRINRVIESKVKVFHLETVLNNDTYPWFLKYLQKKEKDWSALDRLRFQATRISMNLLPLKLRRKIYDSILAPYKLVEANGGEVEAVHERTLKRVYEQQLVRVEGQTDIFVFGLPNFTPYSVNSVLNPILFVCMTLGYMFNMYLGRPVIKKGGVMVIAYPLDYEFNVEHHPSYKDFYDEFLTKTLEPREINTHENVRRYATNPKYLKAFREGFAFHGYHPFTTWNWASVGLKHVGKVIVVGARNPNVVKTLGFENAATFREGIESAKNFLKNPNATITVYHAPPPIVCDLRDN